MDTIHTEEHIDLVSETYMERQIDSGSHHSFRMGNKMLVFSD